MIGSAISQALLRRGYEVRHLSRNPRSIGKIRAFKWSQKEEYIDPKSFDGVDVVIHLAGAPISPKRWSKERIELLDTSRSVTARLLLDKLLLSVHKPSVFISSSGGHYHGVFTSNKVLVEDDPAGNDVMGTICQHWEAAADAYVEWLNFEHQLF